MDNKEHVKAYVDFLMTKLDVNRPLKVVVDCSNGPTGIVMSELIKKFFPDILLVAINDRIDPDFSAHGPDPSHPGAILDVADKVAQTGADLGVVFDGDGDRAVFVNEKGKAIPSQIIAAYLIENTPGIHIADTIIYEALVHADKRLRERIIVSKVGRYFINKEMHAQKGVIGAEFSGHFFFAEFYGADCAILMMIKVLNMLSRSDKPISKQIDKFSRHSVFAEKANISKPFNGYMKAVKVHAMENKPRKVSDSDGLTIDFGDSWINMRPSNTEPVIRITAGASKQKDAESLAEEYKALFV